MSGVLLLTRLRLDCVFCWFFVAFLGLRVKSNGYDLALGRRHYD
jgi:hypothetical protein